jgi:hypothetical protein
MSAAPGALGPRSRRERGDGSIFKRTYRDPATGDPVECATWTIKYSVNGKPRREATRTAEYQKARRILLQRLAEVRTGTFVGPEADRTTYGDLARLLLDDYRINGKRSLERMEDACAHLQVFFGHARARDITTDRVLRYVRQRQENDQAANGTVNRELAALKRMFTLGVRARKITGAQRPYIGMLEERNTRTGFFEPDQFRAVVAHLPEPLSPSSSARTSRDGGRDRNC